MNEEFKTGMVIDETMKADLLSSANWAKFLLVLQTIGVAIVLIMGIAMIALGGKFPGMMPAETAPFVGGVGIAVGIIYVLLALILIYPIAKGFQFANGVKAACKTGSEAQLARGFAGMHSFLKFYGIFAIICLVIYALIAILGIIGFCAMQGSCPA